MGVFFQGTFLEGKPPICGGSLGGSSTPNGLQAEVGHLSSLKREQNGGGSWWFCKGRQRETFSGHPKKPM